MDFALAYITVWPVVAVIVDTAKVMFGELRPNFIARCFFNGTTGVSKTLSAEELVSFDFDINDCPGERKTSFAAAKCMYASNGVPQPNFSNDGSIAISIQLNRLRFS